MLVGSVLVTLAVAALLAAARRDAARDAALQRLSGAALTLVVLAAVIVTSGTTAGAAIVPTVDLGTSAADAVLAGSTVTNTGATTLDGSLALWPGTAVSGFPPGTVLPPGTTNIADPVAQQAQADLTAAYVDAAGRPIDATTTADLVNLTLQGGVYAGPSKSPLSLSGPLTLDGAGDPTSVFIFQTDSTLITSSGSTVTLINGAQACNVFWQVGSSATLGTGSVFTGNILALTSVTVASSVTVHGRALARNGAVTLDDDTFLAPTCDLTTPTTTTSSPGSTTTLIGATTTLGGPTTTTGGATTTLAGPTTTALTGPATTALTGPATTAIAGTTTLAEGTTTIPGTTTTGAAGASTTTPDQAASTTSTLAGGTTSLPATGQPARELSLVALAAIGLGTGLLVLSRRRQR